MEKAKRIEWVDVVKYVCIIMVVISHLEARTKIWAAFFTPFFLSAFFFTAGYVYKPGSSFKNFIYKKFRQLFVPWLIFSVFDIVLSQVITFNAHADLLEEMKWNFLKIRGCGDKLWFVAALFVAFIPFYFFIRWYESHRRESGNTIAVVLACLFSLVGVLYTLLVPADLFPWKSKALPWHIEQIFEAMFYMILGYVFRHNAEKQFDKCNTLQTRITASAAYLLLVFVPYFLKIRFPAAMTVLYSYITTFVGIVMLVSVAKTIKSNSYISYVGQNTLIFFALHGKVLSIIQALLKKFAAGWYAGILKNIVEASMFCLGCALIISAILIVPAYIINRWFPFVVGRTLNRRSETSENSYGQ